MMTLPRALVFLAAFLTATTFAHTGFAKNVLQAADEAGTFSIFLKAVKTTGMTDVLSGEGPFTILAPTDDAFMKLPKKVFKTLFDAESPESKAKLKSVIKNHVVEGTVVSTDVAGRRRAMLTMTGSMLTVSGARGFTVENAKVTRPDILADNGVVHVVDAVLLPKQ